MTLNHDPETGCYIETYKDEIEVLWCPALIEKFRDRLEDIAADMLGQFHRADGGKVRTGLLSIEKHIILFAGDPCDAGYSAVADLAVLKPTGEFTEINGETVPAYMPVPAHTVTGRG